MPNPTWQINPALSVTKVENTIQLGQLSKHSFNIEDKRHLLWSLIRSLIFTGPMTSRKLIRHFGIFTKDPEAMICDFKKLKLIIPYQSPKSRFARHSLYYGLTKASPEAQTLLRSKHVFMIGAGGIGSTCAMLLSAAGVGQISLLDPDLLELSNLPRTVLFNETDVGRTKVEVARDRIREKNSEVQVHSLKSALDSATLSSLMAEPSQPDVLILSGDSGPEVHSLSYEWSKEKNIALINSGYIETYGVVGPMTHGYSEGREREFNRYVDPEVVPAWPALTAPSFGPLNTLVSSITVNEVIRYLIGQKAKTQKYRLILDSETYAQTWEKWS